MLVLGIISCRADPVDTIATDILEWELQVINNATLQDPVVLRFDEVAESLLSRAQQLPSSSQAKFVANGLSVEGQMYTEFGMSDLLTFASFLLGNTPLPHVDLHRDQLEGKDLSAELKATYTACVQAYGNPLPLQSGPIYKVAYGYQHATNARAQGLAAQLDNRCVVELNWPALATGRLWDSAIIHETWHCFQFAEQATARSTLLEQALLEGVVMHLTKHQDATLDDATIMFWNQQEWNDAETYQEAIASAFTADRNSVDQAVVRQYMVLGNPLTAVPDAPSRCGYYVALLAVRAWQAANPASGPRDLITASAQSIWAAFSGATTGAALASATTPRADVHKAVFLVRCICSLAAVMVTTP